VGVEQREDIRNMIVAQSNLSADLRDYSGSKFTKQGGVQPPDRPGFNPFSLDIFSTGSYASGAYLKNQQERRLGRTGAQESEMRYSLVKYYSRKRVCRIETLGTGNEV